MIDYERAERMWLRRYNEARAALAEANHRAESLDATAREYHDRIDAARALLAQPAYDTFMAQEILRVLDGAP